MAIHSWPKMERPRERLIACGENVLSDAELLALFLGSGLPGGSAVDLARSILDEFGSLKEFLSADRDRLMQPLGIGPARYALLRAALELARRCHRDTLRERPGTMGPRATHEFLLSKLRDRPTEAFHCLYLDNRFRLISFEELFGGIVEPAAVSTREVVRQVLAHNASAVVFAHSYPTKIREPSEGDRLLTQQLKDSLALVNVRVLDQIAVGGGQCISFAEQGLLTP